MKLLSEGLRNIFAQDCKIRYLRWIYLIFHVLVTCCSRKLENVPLPRAAGSYELQSPIGLLVIMYLWNRFVPTKNWYSPLSCLLFKERKWQTAKMEFTGMTRRTKEEIEINEELMVTHHWSWQSDKNINFIKFRLKWWQYIWSSRW